MWDRFFAQELKKLLQTPASERKPGHCAAKFIEMIERGEARRLFLALASTCPEEPQRFETARKRGLVWRSVVSGWSMGTRWSQ